MDEFVQRIYLQELERQCLFANQAMELTVHFFSEWDKNIPLSPSDVAPANLDATRREIFRNLHSFLTHAANISKVLWPMRERNPASNEIARARAEHLKGLLAITDDNPLKSRAIRNHLDHYDSRLDEWATRLESSTFTGIITDTIGSYTKPLIVSQRIDPDDIRRSTMRWLDPDTLRFHFRGEFVDFNVAYDAIREIAQKVEPFLRAP